MSDLDHDIAVVAGLVGLLLVFVTGYLSALWPQVADLLELSRPEGKDARARLTRRLRSFSLLTLGVAIIGIGVLAVMTPLSYDVLTGVECRAPYSPIRAGFALVYVYTALVALTAVALTVRLRRRAKSVAS